MSYNTSIPSFKWTCYFLCLFSILFHLLYCHSFSSCLSVPFVRSLQYASMLSFFAVFSLVLSLILFNCHSLIYFSLSRSLLLYTLILSFPPFCIKFRSFHQTVILSVLSLLLCFFDSSFFTFYFASLYFSLSLSPFLFVLSFYYTVIRYFLFISFL